ncbi:hypothetical protein V3C99_010657 [Haemonchus contortus]
MVYFTLMTLYRGFYLVGMHVRLKPTAFVDVQLICTRILAILFICGLIYAMICVYRVEISRFNSFRSCEHEPTVNYTKTIIVVTPTHKRKERIADMLRL